MRPTIAEVDLDAIRHNVSLLRRIASPAALCAVVKADGYGHGALEASVAALEAGATLLAVALVDEGVALRDAGIDGSHDRALRTAARRDVPTALEANLEPAVYTRDGVQEALRVRAAGARCAGVAVHLKVDTGMHRVGCAPDEAVDLARAIARLVLSSSLGRRLDPLRGRRRARQRLHRQQLAAFDEVVAALGASAVIRPRSLHAANSAARIAHPAARLRPRAMRHRHLRPRAVAGARRAGARPGLRPAMSLQARSCRS